MRFSFVEGMVFHSQSPWHRLSRVVTNGKTLRMSSFQQRLSFFVSMFFMILRDRHNETECKMKSEPDALYKLNPHKIDEHKIGNKHIIQKRECIQINHSLNRRVKISEEPHSFNSMVIFIASNLFLKSSESIAFRMNPFSFLKS